MDDCFFIILREYRIRSNFRDFEEYNILRKRIEVGVLKDIGKYVCIWVVGMGGGDRRIKRGVCRMNFKVLVKNYCMFFYLGIFFVF